MTYTCNVCGVTSDAAQFYNRVTSRCKECHKARVRENRAQKAEYYRAYDSARYAFDHKVKARIIAYQSSDAGKVVSSRCKREWAARNADKRAAHVILNNAVRDRRVEKPDSCQACGAKGVTIDGHHQDYSKPLDVDWLCKPCHRKIHHKPYDRAERLKLAAEEALMSTRVSF